ncbi:hypothetical protein PC117_g18628 [Phytophthora cactorum]|uniref:Homeodomain-like n=1 Tax=Phytophthora cactorum TaxID=29920 RepID=A0A8T1C5R5_9STRA|nr:hypothetical protein PC117_g18628 [Phytophthora cactorum]
MVGKGRGKRLTDSERMEIIARLENPSSQLSKAEWARQHGVTPAAIGKLMKVSQSVKKRYSDTDADSATSGSAAAFRRVSHSKTNSSDGSAVSEHVRCRCWCRMYSRKPNYWPRDTR